MASKRVAPHIAWTLCVQHCLALALIVSHLLTSHAQPVPSNSPSATSATNTLGPAATNNGTLKVLNLTSYTQPNLNTTLVVRLFTAQTNGTLGVPKASNIPANMPSNTAKPTCYRRAIPNDPCKDPNAPPLPLGPYSLSATAPSLKPATILRAGTYNNYVVPANVHMQLGPGRYNFTGSLTIKGRLTCNTTRNIAMFVQYMSVDGAFICGTPTTPHTGGFTLTFVASVPGSKQMMVGGVLQLVGSPRSSWTTITNQHIVPGSTSFFTMHKVDWQVGEQIVVTSTDYKPGNTEARMISKVTHVGTGSLVEVSVPFAVHHWGTVQTFTDSKGKTWTLDERAQVGLLNRNIVLQGDGLSEKTGIGGSITILNGGHAQVRDVRFFRMGHIGILGAYPIHWHKTGDRRGNWLSNSVIVKSFNRCMTLHATDNVVVDRNVCYDHIGHGYMLEDGCEVGNTFRRNLGILTRAPTPNATVTLSDATHLSTFWISNSMNHVIDNVAAGYNNTGFWMLRPVRPNTRCANSGQTVQPSTWGVFSGNIAHSGDIGIGWEPIQCGTLLAPSCSGSYPTNPFVFNNLTVFKNSNPLRGLWITVDDQGWVQNSAFGDNGGLLVSGKQIISDSLIVGQSANNVTDVTQMARLGFGIYDGPTGLVRVHITGILQKPIFHALGAVNAAWKKWCHFVEDVRLDPGLGTYFKWAYRLNTTQAEGFVSGLIDVDGGVTGVKNSVLVGALGNNFPNITRNSSYQDRDFQAMNDSCTLNRTWGAYVCTGLEYANVRIHHDFPVNITAPRINVSRSDGKVATLDHTGRPWYQFAAITNRKLDYTVKYFDNNAISWDAAKRPRAFYIQVAYASPNTALRLNIANLPTGPWTYTAVRCNAAGAKTVVIPPQASGSFSVMFRPTGWVGATPNLRMTSDSVRVCTTTPDKCACPNAPI